LSQRFAKLRCNPIVYLFSSGEQLLSEVLTLAFRNCPTVCVSRWWAGRDSLREQKKLEARKMPENGAESHQSAARFVGVRFVAPDSLAVKDLPAKRLTRLLHETLTLAITKKL
jgi:hypothetical protein